MELAAEPVRVWSARSDGHEDAAPAALVHGIEAVPGAVAREADAAVLRPREAVARVRNVRPCAAMEAVLAGAARPRTSSRAAEIGIAAAEPGHQPGVDEVVRAAHGLPPLVA